MRKTNSFLFLALSLILSLTACSDKKHFVVSGSISNATGSVLYLEKEALMQTTVIDSCVLKSSGDYSFKVARPQYPEFFRLRIKNSDILFAIDSCEHVTIKASAKEMTIDYTVDGSPASSNIKQLRLSLRALQNKIASLLKTRTPENQNQVTATLDSAIAQHKQLGRNIVLQNPLSSASYYAIFQQVNGYNFFTPFDKSDRRYCAAVATAYNAFYPKSERSVSLYNFVMQAIVADRQARNQEALGKMLQGAKTGIIDVELPDNHGKTIKLSQLQGKVILLDFSQYQGEHVSEYIFALRDMYNKYHTKGFEIYQISLDEDIDFWRESAENLPWICVHSNGGTPAAVTSYNVIELPTRFLIGKSGEVIKRNPTAADVQKAVGGAL